MSNFTSSIGISKGALAFLASLLCLTAHAQHSVTLSAQYAAPNNCNDRVLTANVSGGSGNYTYFWTSQPSSGANLGNTPTITVSPNQTTTYTSGVYDIVTGQFAQDQETIGRILTGSFSVYIPNVMTPNGDGYNDVWQVTDASQSTGPLNAYQYTLTIVNNWGGSVMSGNGTITSGTEGYVGGQIYWNGRINNTGSYVSDGVYYYSVRLYNCSGNQNYTGSISVLGAPSLLLYPNPANNTLRVTVNDEDALVASDKDYKYDVRIFSKNGNQLIHEKLKTKTATIDISSLPKDTYFVKVNLEGAEVTQKLIIDK